MAFGLCEIDPFDCLFIADCSFSAILNVCSTFYDLSVYVSVQNVVCLSFCLFVCFILKVSSYKLGVSMNKGCTVEVVLLTKHVVNPIKINSDNKDFQKKVFCMPSPTPPILKIGRYTPAVVFSRSNCLKLPKIWGLFGDF